MAGPSDFRARAAELAGRIRTTNSGNVGAEDLARDVGGVSDPVQAQMASAGDDAYTRRGLGGPISAGAAQDVALRQAASAQSLQRRATTEALSRRRAGLKATWSSMAAQEAIDEALRRLAEEKRRREAAMYGDLAGTAGMLIGGYLGGPGGAAAGQKLGQSAGSNLGGG